MKKFLFIIFAIFIFINICFAETVNLIWKNGDSTYSQSICTVGGDLIVPSTTPTKTGYNFVGWNIKKAKELEYVSFKQTFFNYINTGIIFDSDEIEYETKLSPSNVYVAAFGASDTCTTANMNITNSAGVLNFKATNTDVGFIAGNNRLSSTKTQDSINVYYLYINKSTIFFGIRMNNEEMVYNNFSGTPVSNRTIFIGGINYGAFDNNYCFFSGRIYYFKIKKDGVLVRDFIPAKDPNGVVCMYDKVSKQFFYTPNGALGAGPEVQ